MGSLVFDVVERLKAGGWEEIRASKHRIFRHPNGATHCLPHRLSDRESWRRIKQFKEIEQKEADPSASGRDPKICDVTPKETPDMLHPTPPTRPAPTAPPPPPAAVGIPSTVSASKPRETSWFKWAERVRADRRIGRADLATTLHWTTSALKRFERGEYTPTPGEVAAWARAVDIDVPENYIPTREGEPATITLTKKPVPALKVENDPTPWDAKAFGKWLKDQRAKYKIRAEDLTEALEIPMSTYYRMERGVGRSRNGADVVRKGVEEFIARLKAPKPSAPVEGPAESPKAISAGEPDKDRVIQRITKLLSNPRLTPEEVSRIGHGVEDAVIRVLLGEC